MNNSSPSKDPIYVIALIAAIALTVAVVAGILYAFTGETASIQQSALSTEIARVEAENDKLKQENQAAIAQAQQQAAEAAAQEATVATNYTGGVSSWTAELEGSQWTVEDLGTAPLEDVHTETYTRNDLMKGGLLLVNAWHSIPEDFTEDGLLVVGTTGDYKVQVDSAQVRLFPAAFNALVEALQAAEAEGISHYIVREGYRSIEEQTELFNTKMQKLSSRYSGNQLIEKTKKEVNYPGTSDYHTGMTFRMDVYERGNSELNNQKFQSESQQGAWLTANCWKYGIIFRFPTEGFPASMEDKSYKTGVSAQLNMYRYVGKAHAAAMKVLGMCLEEYIEFLMEHPHISISENGGLRYEVIRISSLGDRSEAQLPVFNMASEVQASMDNMDGVVVAFTY